MTSGPTGTMTSGPTGTMTSGPTGMVNGGNGSAGGNHAVTRSSSQGEESYHRGMVDPREAAVRAIEEVTDALMDARAALYEAELAARRGLRRKDRGVPSADLLRADPVTNHRRQLDGTLRRLETARHTMAVATFRVCLDQGMSIGELSRIYGFSRQRAARYAAEARANRAVETATWWLSDAGGRPPSGAATG